MKNKILVLVPVIAFVGCVPAPRSVPNLSYNEIIAERPKFWGWDENGFKKSNATPLGGQLKKAKDSTILNEDTIICETVEPLLLVDDERFKNFEELKYGSIMMDTMEKSIVHTKESAHESTLLNIRSSYRFAPGGTDLDRAVIATTEAAEKANYNAEQAKYKNRIDEESSFVKLCKVNKEPLPVDVVERKPISGITKIKINLDKNYYEVFTYDFQLTFQK